MHLGTWWKITIWLKISLASVHYFQTKSVKQFYVKKNNIFILKPYLYIILKKKKFNNIETCVHQNSLFSSVALLSYDQTLGCFWGDRLNHPILMTVLLLLFLLGGQKELHGEFKFWWSDQISLQFSIYEKSHGTE